MQPPPSTSSLSVTTPPYMHLPLHQWVIITPFLPTKHFTLRYPPYIPLPLKKNPCNTPLLPLLMCLYCLIPAGWVSLLHWLTSTLESWACFSFTFPLNVRGWWQGTRSWDAQEDNYGENKSSQKHVLCFSWLTCQCSLWGALWGGGALCSRMCPVRGDLTCSPLHFLPALL